MIKISKKIQRIKEIKTKLQWTVDSDGCMLIKKLLNFIFKNY